MDLLFGGWGGRPHADGVDGASPMVMGGGYGSMPAELLEREYPVVIEGFGFVPDTEGPGRHRGRVSVYWGGCGEPYERDPELVALDVAEGKISIERARAVYGVVIRPEDLTLDREGTL